MAELGGVETVEVAASVERCYALAADVERAPSWQGGHHANEVLETDAEGRPGLVRATVDLGIRTVAVVMRLEYEPPFRLRWERVEGDLRSLHGGWDFAALDPGRTRATYEMRGDPGRILGRLAAPIAGLVREQLVGAPPAGLKRAVEESPAR